MAEPGGLRWRTWDLAGRAVPAKGGRGRDRVGKRTGRRSLRSRKVWGTGRCSQQGRRRLLKKEEENRVHLA